MEKMEFNINKIKQELNLQPWKYSLHQTLFLLEYLNSEKKNFSFGSCIEQEPLALKANYNLSTASSDILKIKNQELIINHSSLIGINSILPNIYTEKIILQNKEKKTTLLDFFNIFHHRYFSLVHKNAKKKHISLNVKSEFIQRNYISGLNNEIELKKKFSPFISLLWQKNKTPHNLKHILESIFEFKIKINQFLPQFFEIEEEYHINNDKKLNNKVLGKQAICYTKGISLHIFLNSFEQFKEHIPNSKNAKLLKMILNYYLEPNFKVKIYLKMKKSILLELNLNQKKQLGILTCLGTSKGTYVYEYII